MHRHAHTGSQMSSKVTASATDESDSSAPSWLAVWTRPRAEKVAARALESLSVSVWLPTINSRRRWSDRWKVVELPLFPGYLFAKSSAEAWSKLLRAQGVLTVVKLGKAPAWIRDNQMTELRCAVERVARDAAEPQVERDVVEGERGGLP